MKLKEWLELQNVKTARYIEVYDETKNIHDQFVVGLPLSDSKIMKYLERDIIDQHILHDRSCPDIVGYVRVWSIARCKISTKSNLRRINYDDYSNLA